MEEKKMTTQEIIEVIKGLSVLELNELVKACEEEFGVSAAAGVVVAAGAGAAEEVEEKTEFDVELTEVGAQKVKVIKVVREITGLGLKEAKAVVDGAPKVVKDLEGTNAFAISKDDATLAARTVAKFIKKAKVCKLKCGVVEGTYYDEKGIEVIATIPSREELIAKFMGSIQSPIANFARVIKQIAEKDGEAAAE